MLIIKLRKGLSGHGYFLHTHTAQYVEMYNWVNVVTFE